jgi:hypothetical protein
MLISKQQFCNLLSDIAPPRRVNSPPAGGIIVIAEDVHKKRQSTTRKKHGFGVVVTELGNSMKYLKSLQREIRKYPLLLEQSQEWWGGKKVSKAAFNDAIIFGDAPQNFTYDYRLGTLQDVQESGVTRIYDLVVDFQRIQSALKKYYTANYGGDYFFPQHHFPCCRPPRKKRTSSTSVRMTTTVNINRPVQKRKKSKLDKVSVFNNYVKVGFNQYDIFLTSRKRKEFVIIDGHKFWVKADVLGNRRIYPA